MREPTDTNSNCIGNKIYSYGSYVENEDLSKCYHIPPEIVKNVYLIDKIDLKIDYIKYLPPQIASSDSAS